MKTSYSKPEIIEVSTAFANKDCKQNNNLKANKSSNYWQYLLLLIPLYFVYTLFYAPYRLEKEIQENGIVATGKLIEVVETGNTFNDKPELKLKFEVTDSKGEKWKGETRRVFSFLDLPKLAIGSKINIKYNPKDKTQVVIVD
jgi:hypothetical protein